MAQQLFFSRDTKVYIKFGTKVWDLPVLDGFSFSQATNSSEITLAEMEGSGGSSRRGRKQFNDSLAPAEWSFATYVRPFKAAGGSAAGTADGAALTHAVEEVLWAMFLGGKSYADDHQLFQDATPTDVGQAALVEGKSYVIKTAGTTNWTGIGAANANVGTAFVKNGTAVSGSGGVAEDVLNVPAATSSKFNADLSNKATLGTADIFFVLGDANRKVYKLKDCVVNEASLDFDIDGIATINWSGMSSEIIDMTSRTITTATNPPAYNAVSGASGAIVAGDVLLESDNGHRLSVVIDPTSSGTATMTTGVYEGTTSTTNFIRNRLTQLTVVPTANTSYIGSLESGGYDITLTGGNITMTNNVTFITPEEIGLVNTPIGHVTGTRSVSGSMNCYLSKDTTVNNNSADLWEDLKGITSVVTNSFALDFKIGGTSASTPRLQVSMPTCHLEIPTHSIEDVISVETAFNALPSTIDGTNEATITYFSKQ
tara:strand:+ start:2096 stop:3547 length:1452 start_codon:yes stop_codon:yes gene_type:complete